MRPNNIDKNKYGELITDAQRNIKESKLLLPEELGKTLDEIEIQIKTSDLNIYTIDVLYNNINDYPNSKDVIIVLYSKLSTIYLKIKKISRKIRRSIKKNDSNLELVLNDSFNELKGTNEWLIEEIDNIKNGDLSDEKLIVKDQLGLDARINTIISSRNIPGLLSFIGKSKDISIVRKNKVLDKVLELKFTEIDKLGSTKIKIIKLKDFYYSNQALLTNKAEKGIVKELFKYNKLRLEDSDFTSAKGDVEQFLSDFSPLLTVSQKDKLNNKIKAIIEQKQNKTLKDEISKLDFDNITSVELGLGTALMNDKLTQKNKEYYIKVVVNELLITNLTLSEANISQKILDIGIIKDVILSEGKNKIGKKEIVELDKAVERYKKYELFKTFSNLWINLAYINHSKELRTEISGISNNINSLNIDKDYDTSSFVSKFILLERKGDINQNPIIGPSLKLYFNSEYDMVIGEKEVEKQLKSINGIKFDANLSELKAGLYDVFINEDEKISLLLTDEILELNEFKKENTELYGKLDNLNKKSNYRELIDYSVKIINEDPNYVNSNISNNELYTLLFDTNNKNGTVTYNKVKGDYKDIENFRNYLKVYILDKIYKNSTIDNPLINYYKNNERLDIDDNYDYNNLKKEINS